MKDTIELTESIVRDVRTFVLCCIDTPRDKPFPLNYVYLDEGGRRIEVQITINVIKE